MTAAAVIAALCLPADARVDQRVPKKLLLEQGAPTAADKRVLQEGVEELVWIAALKPGTVGVPAYRDGVREYLEVAVLSAGLRADAKTGRIVELIHRAIPYPVLLLLAEPAGMRLSLAHVRWSQGQDGKTVLEGAPVTATVGAGDAGSGAFVDALALVRQPREHLLALYQGWIECFEALAAARVTGRFSLATDAEAAGRRRAALAEHERLTREIAALRAAAEKERQLNRLAEMNIALRSLALRQQDVTGELECSLRGKKP